MKHDSKGLSVQSSRDDSYLREVTKMTKVVSRQNTSSVNMDDKIKISGDSSADMTEEIDKGQQRGSTVTERTHEKSKVHKTNKVHHMMHK